MFESLIALALRSLPAGLLGGYLLSGTAVRGVSPADRPSRRVLVGVLLASAVGGFVVMFVAVAALLASAPSADVAQLPSILPIMFAAGVVLTDVKRYKPCQR